MMDVTTRFYLKPISNHSMTRALTPQRKTKRLSTVSARNIINLL